MADMATTAHKDGEAHAHPAYLAHHFDTPVQQFDSGKLGMWLFLATEVLLFGGLFCAYFIYRSNHMEMFHYAHQFLDKKMGLINTIILLASSFTMASGVYCAQRGNMTWLKINLALTFLGGAGFMAIKYVEYSHKIHEGLVWGKHYHYDPSKHHDGGHAAASAPAADSHAAPPPAAAPPAPAVTADGDKIEPWNAAPADPARLRGPAGLSPAALPGDHGGHAHTQPDNVQVFFSVYFLMTGLHGIHVLAGMAVIAWLFYRTVKGHFSAEFFTPVDLGGLYWHLVDLIWIYLFPLLYLIE